MRILKWIQWGHNNYPLVNLDDFSLSAISKDHYHHQMNVIPELAVEGKIPPELLFRLTFTQLLQVYERCKTYVPIDEFVSDALVCFWPRFLKYNPSRGNWYSYCGFIRFDLIKLLRKKYEEDARYVEFNLSDFEQDGLEEDYHD